MSIRAVAARLGAPALLTSLVPAVTPAAATVLPRVNIASTRPASCPAPSPDPNSGDGEPQTALGTFPWPAPPPGTDPARCELYEHTAWPAWGRT